MKTGKFLLTAFASLALSTAAYADKEIIKVSNWVPQSPVAGEAIYVNELATTGAPSDMFFTKIALGETPTMAFSKENDYKLQNMGLEIVDIAFNVSRGKIYSYDETGTVIATQDDVTISQKEDATCTVSYWYKSGKRPKYMERDVAFIGEAQYKYHVAAQKAADILNESEYTGSTYSQLVNAITQPAMKWDGLAATIDGLLDQYVADKEAVEKAIKGLPEYGEDGKVKPILLGTLGGKESYTFDLTGVNPDDVDITVGKDNPNFEIDGTKVTFAPTNRSWPSGFAHAYVDNINVNVKGIATTIPVIGYNPGLTWNRYYYYPEYPQVKRITFNEPGVYPADENTKLRFYAAGYQGLYENPEFEVVYPNDAAKNAFDVEITKVDNENPSANYAFEAYDVKVTFKENATVGDNCGTFYIKEKKYGQKLTLVVEAWKHSIEITDEEGDPLSAYSFSKNGGTQRFGVKYAGFSDQDEFRLSIDEFKQGSPFSAKFVETDGTLSQALHGSGLIYIDVTCEAENADEKEWTKFVESTLKVRLYNCKTSDEITLRRYNAPKLSYADDEEKHEITLGGEVFDTHIDFNADGFGSIYSKDDIKIFTDCDVFVVGKMISWNKDGNRATISLKYDPTHAGVEMKGILYIMYNDQMLTYDLTGLAVSQAKIDELHGISTGIENVEAEGAAQNGVMFNVAGQRVNGAAKGLVIKNGKKYIVK